MRRSRLPLAAIAIAASVLCLVRDARAEEEPDADAARLADGKSTKKNWVPAGCADRYGHAEVLVHAPLAEVKKDVLDFPHYRDFVPDKFHHARVIGKEEGGTDVYMQLPIMNGLVTLWQVMRFRDVKPIAPGWAIVEGFFVKGNLKKANASWTLHAVDANTTVLEFDLLIVPLIPAPQSAIDEELRDAAMAAVDAIRDRAQKAASAPSPAAAGP